MKAVFCVSELIYVKHLENCPANTKHHGNVRVIVLLLLFSLISLARYKFLVNEDLAIFLILKKLLT